MFCPSKKSRILGKDSSQSSDDQFTRGFVLFCAMSTILATELFQARRDAAIATSKLLLENSGYKLLNAPVNARSLFGNKIKEVTKYKVQQQRFLASSSASASQQQKPSYLAIRSFIIPKLPNKQSGPKQSQTYRSKTQTQSFTSSTRKDSNKQ